MYFATVKFCSGRSTGIRCPASSIKPCEQSCAAEPQRWVDMFKSVTSAVIGEFITCRNRHCPKCQAMRRAEWLDARCRELLPVPYFHVVFTLPQQLAPLALQNKRVIYGILFQAAAETLKEVAANPKHLGAEIGILAVLHTWGQKLMHHPHIHTVVTGGGLAPDGGRWIPCKRSRRRRKPIEPLCPPQSMCLLSCAWRGAGGKSGRLITRGLGS